MLEVLKRHKDRPELLGKALQTLASIASTSTCIQYIPMEEHVYSILAVEGKQQPELPPKYIHTKSTDDNIEHIERGRTLGAQT